MVDKILYKIGSLQLGSEENSSSWINNENPFWKKFKSLFGLDKRAIALCRIALATLVLFDIYNRFDEAYAHYSDHGVLPRSKTLDLYWNYYWFCFNLLSGEVYWQQFLFLLQAVFAICMLIGYRTRLFTFLTWIMILSIQSRNYLVGHGGDIVTRMYLFWVLFLPLGEYYSVDSALKKVKKSEMRSSSHEHPRQKKVDHQMISGASLGLLVQFCLLYVFSYVHKTGDEWTVDYTATFYALQLDYFRRPLADFFLMFPTLCKLMTWGVLQFEGFGSLLWFIPFATDHFRMAATLGFIAMHLGFQACMRLGIFGWVCAFGVLAAIPTWYWNFVLNRLRTRERLGFTLYYNTPGSLNHKVVEIIKTFFLIEETRVVCLQTQYQNNGITSEDEGFQSENEDSHKPTPLTTSCSYLLARETNGRVTQDFGAFITVCKLSPILWPLYYFFLRFEPVATLGMRASDAVVNAVDSTMLAFGYTFDTEKRIQPRLRSPKTKVKRAFNRIIKIGKNVTLNIFTLLCLYICITWNFDSIGKPEYGTPENLKTMGFILHLDQAWGMFSPRPPTNHWYYVMIGTLEDGSEIDVWKNESMFNWQGSRPVTFDKPDPFHLTVKSHRWFKFYEMYNNNQHSGEIRNLFGQYLCREWNKRHVDAELLKGFKVHFMVEDQLLDGSRVLQPANLIWDHTCS